MIVGRITSEIAQNLPIQKQGDIVLDAIGITHIKNRHGKEIHQAGFEDVLSFVRYVLQNVDALYRGNHSRTFQLVVRGERPYKQAVIKLEFSEDGDFYRVMTAGHIRCDFFKNKTPLWERAQSNHLRKETPGAVSGQSSAMSDKDIIP